MCGAHSPCCPRAVRWNSVEYSVFSLILLYYPMVWWWIQNPIISESRRLPISWRWIVAWKQNKTEHQANNNVKNPKHFTPSYEQLSAQRLFQLMGIQGITPSSIPTNAWWANYSKKNTQHENVRNVRLFCSQPKPDKPSLKSHARPFLGSFTPNDSRLGNLAYLQPAWWRNAQMNNPPRQQRRPTP